MATLPGHRTDTDARTTFKSLKKLKAEITAKSMKIFKEECVRMFDDFP